MHHATVDSRCAKKIVTLEGLGTPDKPHRVQKAFIDEQAAQCGYCINGMIMESAAFLAKNKKPTEADIKNALPKILPLRHACPHRARRQAMRRFREAHMNIQISRRDALLGSGALIVSFALAGSPTGAQAQTAAKPLALTKGHSFLAIDKTGKVTVYSGKVDLGTGITTALRQIVAEELDVPTGRIELVQGDTSLTPDQGTTWGSLTVQVGGMQLRQAAAAARQALMTEAAKRLGTDQLTVTDGVVSGGGKKVSYGELIGGKTFAITLDPKQPVKEKAPKDYKVVGKSQPRVDIADKVTGRFTYMQDFKVPGMLRGRVVRPPAIGAKLESMDDSAVKKIPGVVKIVREGNFLAVVASNEWDAIRGADALKANWSKSETLPDQAKLWDYVRNSKITKLSEYGKAGDTAAAMAADGVKKINATYDFAIHTHGSIGASSVPLPDSRTAL